MIIKWNGISSDSLGLRVEEYPSYMLPGRQVDAVAIPGRNGDAIFNNGAWENYVQSYKVYVSAEAIQLPAAMRSITDWLYAPSGYAVLEDDYDATTYRMAYFSDMTEIDNIQNEYGEFIINFVCAPKRYIKETAISVSENLPYLSSNLTNSTIFETYPTFEIDISSITTRKTLSFGIQRLNPDLPTEAVNVSTFDVDGTPMKKIIVDCENRIVYGVKYTNAITHSESVEILASGNTAFDFPHVRSGETAYQYFIRVVSGGGTPAVTGTIKENRWTL